MFKTLFKKIEDRRESSAVYWIFIVGLKDFLHLITHKPPHRVIIYIITCFLYKDDLIKQLTPYKVIGFEEKIRLGNNFDGGYVLPLKILSDLDVAYTYGVSSDVSFEVDLLEHRSIPVRLYDHTIDTLPIKSPNFYFKKEGISDKKSGMFDTFENQVKANNDKDKKILLKMDIEGDEWRVMPGIVDNYSEVIPALVLEVHDLNIYENFAKYTSILKKVNSKFTLVHIHGNNCCPVFRISRYKMPCMCELTFINNKYVDDKSIETGDLPSNLDYPNRLDKQDIVLNFWKK